MEFDLFAGFLAEQLREVRMSALDPLKNTGDNRQEFLCLEWLGYICVYASSKSLNSVSDFVFSRKEYDRNETRPRIRAQVPRQLITVHPRHPYIADNQIRQTLRKQD